MCTTFASPYQIYNTLFFLWHNADQLLQFLKLYNADMKTPIPRLYVLLHPAQHAQSPSSTHAEFELRLNMYLQISTCTSEKHSHGVWHLPGIFAPQHRSRSMAERKEPKTVSRSLPLASSENTSLISLFFFFFLKSPFVFLSHFGDFSL